MSVAVNSSRATQCPHFWVIDSPSGTYSRGVCKHCGEERRFRNSLQVSRWDRETEKDDKREVPLP